MSPLIILMSHITLKLSKRMILRRVLIKILMGIKGAIDRQVLNRDTLPKIIRISNLSTKEGTRKPPILK